MWHFSRVTYEVSVCVPVPGFRIRPLLFATGLAVGACTCAAASYFMYHWMQRTEPAVGDKNNLMESCMREEEQDSLLRLQSADELNVDGIFKPLCFESTSSAPPALVLSEDEEEISEDHTWPSPQVEVRGQAVSAPSVVAPFKSEREQQEAFTWNKPMEEFRCSSATTALSSSDPGTESACSFTRPPSRVLSAYPILVTPESEEDTFCIRNETVLQKEKIKKCSSAPDITRTMAQFKTLQKEELVVEVLKPAVLGTCEMFLPSGTSTPLPQPLKYNCVDSGKVQKKKLFVYGGEYCRMALRYFERTWTLQRQRRANELQEVKSLTAGEPLYHEAVQGDGDRHLWKNMPTILQSTRSVLERILDSNSTRKIVAEKPDFCLKSAVLETEVSSDADSTSSDDTYYTCIEYADERGDEMIDKDNSPDGIQQLRLFYLKCQGDTDMSDKIYKIRQAFELLFTDSEVRRFVREAGKIILGGLVTLGKKKPTNFFNYYDQLTEFLEDPSNWDTIRRELSAAGMKNFTFYDIFFDFIALNVIADTENVPTAVKQPLQNRWISVSMKKTTVMFYTWSRIKTKRAYMVEPKGFFYHLYEVYDYTHPEIMWAAFGPESKTKDFFFILKGQIIYFMKDMFSFKSHQFDTPDLLAKEIFENLEQRVRLLSSYLDEERKT